MCLASRDDDGESYIIVGVLPGNFWFSDERGRVIPLQAGNGA